MSSETLPHILSSIPKLLSVSHLLGRFENSPGISCNGNDMMAFSLEMTSDLQQLLDAADWIDDDGRNKLNLLLEERETFLLDQKPTAAEIKAFQVDFERRFMTVYQASRDIYEREETILHSQADMAEHRNLALIAMFRTLHHLETHFDECVAGVSLEQRDKIQDMIDDLREIKDECACELPLEDYHLLEAEGIL